METTEEFSWDYYLNQASSLQHLSNEKRERIKNAILTLKEVMGDDWLSLAFENHHPIIWYLKYISHDTSYRKELEEFANSLSTLKAVKGFDELLSRIKQTDKFEATTTEIALANKILPRCSEFAFSQEIGGKYPDIICKYNNTEFLFEVKTLRTANETEKAMKTSAGLIDACRPIFPGGMIYKVLAEPHLEEVKKLLDKETKSVIEHNQPKEVHIPKVLKFFLMPEKIQDRVKIFQDWANNQEFYNNTPLGFKGGLLGPDDKVNHAFRVRLKLDQMRKKPQIPQNKPGVIILSSRHFFFEEKSVSSFVNTVIESVYELSNIVAVVLYNNSLLFGDLTTKVTRNEDYIFMQNALSDSHEEYIVIVKNRFSKFDFDYQELVRLLSGDN